MKYEYKINNIEYKFNIIHPKLEIYRKKIIEKIFDRFYNILKKYNSIIKKEKAITIITLFIWKNINNIDPVIPYNIDDQYNYDQLIIDLTTYNFDAKKILEELKIDKVFKFYIIFFEKIYNKLNDSIVVIENRDNKLIYKNYEVSYDNMILDKLNKYYNNTSNTPIDKNIIFFCILYRYDILDAGNQQLSIITPFKQDLQKNFNINIELFGSSINRYFNNYCSLFYDLEKYFGSLGNFFNLTPIQGLYFANPPFDEDIMSNMVKHLLLSLYNTTKPLGFIITIPIWDRHTLLKIANKCNISIKNITPTVKYICKDLLMESKYFYKEYIFCKKNFPYYSFKNNQKINASNTYIYIIKNELMNFDTKLFESILKKNYLFFI
jgi:hypothetical protein